MFWVIQNSKPVLDRLTEINTYKKAKTISTFDFSTLYTKLPHGNLIEVMNKLIDFVYYGGRNKPDGNRKFLTVGENRCYFTRTSSSSTSYSKAQIKMMVNHLISQSFFSVGNLVFRQCIGIPMGIDPAPFWANLYLYHFESEFIISLSRTERYRGFKFKHCFRFIDDLFIINDSNEFKNSIKDIYPECLKLKCEHEGSHATFLEIDINIKDGMLIHKLFDKRDAFPFFIVRMPNLSGNIPKHVFYGSISAELLRIARATLLYDEFLEKAQELCKKCLSKVQLRTRLLNL